jgi:hypothetical protein
VSKHWKPRKQTVELQPSRIRREPVRLDSKARVAETEERVREREMWGGVTGVVLFAVALAAAAVGVSAVTILHDDPGAAARAARWGQCYNADGPNCVLDGGTIYVARQKVEIAGLEAPQIQNARCADERSRGIDAAVRLADLLNSGRVTVSGAFRGQDGRVVRKVAVDGEDVGAAMVDADVAREPGSDFDWCAK